jgi:hypothetical protein
VSKYARDHGIDDVDLLNDHNDYRDRFREQAATSGSYVVRTMQYTPGVSNCTGIRTTAVMDAVEFDRDVLETDFELNDSDDSTASDEHDDHDDAGDSTDQPDYLSAGEVEASAGAKSREKLPPVRGTIEAVWQNKYNQPVTELVDDDGSIDIEIEGYELGDVPLSAGGQYEIDGLRYQDPNDAKEYFELRPTAHIERLDDPDDEDEAEELDDGPIPIERIPDIGTSTGYETVTAEVVSWESPDTDAIAHSGIVKDATGIIDVIAFDKLPDAPDDPEDGRYLIEGVQVGEYEGDLQLIFDPRTTDWTKIQTGVGNLDHVGNESNQNLTSATDGGSDTAGTSDADKSAGSDDTTETDETDTETTEMVTPDGLDKSDPNAPDSQKRRIFKIKAKLRTAGTGDGNDFLTADDLEDDLGWNRDIIDATIERLRRESNAMFGDPDEGWQMSK